MNFIRLIVLTLVIILPCSALGAPASTPSPPTAQVDRVLPSRMLADTSPAKQPVPSPTPWLVGTWALTYDPDGSDKDYLDFYADGKVDNRDDKGNHHLSDYSASPGEAVLSVTANGATKTYPLQAVENGTKLKHSSGAEYTRQPDVAGVNYTRSGWSRFVSEKGMFSVLMYGVPLAEVTTKDNNTDSSSYSVQLGNCLFNVRFGTIKDDWKRENISALYENYEVHFIDGISLAEGTILDSSRTTIHLGKLPAREISGKVVTGNEVMYFRSIITVRNNLFYQFTLFSTASFADRAPSIMQSIEFDEK
jgi:hypothetical protein